MNAIEKANLTKKQVMTKYGPLLETCTIILKDIGFVVEATFKAGTLDGKGKPMKQIQFKAGSLELA